MRQAFPPPLTSVPEALRRGVLALVTGGVPGGAVTLREEVALKVVGVHRRRALLYAMAVLLGVLWMAAGLAPWRVVSAAAVAGVGLLSALLLIILAWRQPHLATRWPLVTLWLVLDALVITWAVHLTGGAASPWFVWYLANAGTASVVAGKRPALAVGVLDSFLFLGLLLLRGTPAGETIVAASGLAGMWAASFYFVRGVADLQARRRDLERMRQAQDRSIEELTRMTAALDQRTRELADAKVRIREADRLKGQFVANMSHELRTPLNSIIGFSELLLARLDRDLLPRFQRFLQNIHDAGHQLLGLINDILDLSKIDAGQPELQPEPMVVQTLVDGVCTVLRSTASRRNVTCEARLPADLPLLVADPVKVKQIVYNLVSNGIKFSPEGGTVEIRACHLPAESSPLGTDAIQIAVTDHGIGIDPKHHRLIFQDFVQVDGTASRPFGGAGLGLALARRYVELHHGTISLASTPGMGSTFTVTLPSAPPGGTLPVRPVPTLELPAESGRRILVVEDDPTSFEAIAERLTAAAYVPLRARSCEEALELARTQRPAAITLDLLLPGDDGWETLRSLKADPATGGIPVVVISVMANRELGLALGADDYLLKPLDGERLLQRLGELLPVPVEGPPRVLIIDDDPHLHEILQAKLAPRGYELDHALTGQAGIAQARVRAPHLIILDLMMEGLDGFEVAGLLRHDPRTAEVPIVVFTAKDLGNQDRQRLEGKIEACVEKGRTTGSGIVPVIEDVLRRRTKEGTRAGR